MPTAWRPVAHAPDDAIFFDQLLDFRSHHQPERGILPGLGGQEVEKLFLRDQHDVRKTSPDPVQVENRAWAVGSWESAALNLGMAELMQTIGEADLVEDFQNGRMECVASKLAVEILMRL